jgi:two-component system nitrate/nitrite response regulator NarL
MTRASHNPHGLDTAIPDPQTSARSIRLIGQRGNRIRVLVADDHPIYREGIVRALKDSGSIEVVAELADGREALEQIKALLPDVALLDYKLPRLDGLEVLHAVTRDGLPARVMILSAHSDSNLVYQALQTGAAGYMPKESDRQAIVDGVLAVARGDSVLPTELATGLVAEIRLRSSSDAPALTPRESEILRMIADGKSFPEIASALFLGVTTVKTHVQHVYEKLGVSDRAAAVAEAMRKRLIE